MVQDWDGGPHLLPCSRVMPGCGKHVGLHNGGRRPTGQQLFPPPATAAVSSGRSHAEISPGELLEACRRCWAPSRGEGSCNDSQGEKAEGELKSQTVYLT